MKKYIIVFAWLLILVTGCIMNNDKIEKKDLAADLIIAYRASSNYGTQDEPAYEINVYADKYITYGYSNLDGFTTSELNDEEYQEIVDYIQSEEFLSLEKNLTDYSVSDGTNSSFTIYYLDGSTFYVGGTNVTNETYNGLVNLLRKHKN